MEVNNERDGQVHLGIRGLSKRFGATQALDDVTFDVIQGSVHGLLGGNGSGKSTLIKILAGVYSADSGSISVHGENHEAAHTSPSWAHQQGLRFVHQAVGTFPDMTVAENFALGSTFNARALGPISWRRLHEDVAQVLARFNVDVSPTSQMNTLSPATRSMVAVARAAADHQGDRPGLFVLDEPTAALPPTEVDILLDAISSWRDEGHTVILVTHRLDEVLRVADTATFLRDGRHLETARVDELDERAMARRIAGIDAHSETREELTNDGPVRLIMDDVHGPGLHGVSLEAKEGEVLGLSGLIGSGSSSVLRAIFGADKVRDGNMTLDGNRFAPRSPHDAVAQGVAYVPADRLHDAAFLDQSISNNLAIVRPGQHWKNWRLSPTLERKNAEKVSTDYGVIASSSDALVSSLSGGNQQKVILARWVERKPRMLLLDEPTQGVDVGARAAIHKVVRAAAANGTTVVVASSDHRELAELCDRVVGVSNGQILGEAAGSDLTPSRCLELAHGLGTEIHANVE